MIDAFARRLLEWYDQHGRHDLPWQQDKSPYRVWVSEIMLQQTQVATVIPYYERFMERFPDVAALAGASVDDVLALWSGLGYYSRARNLHAAAQQVRDRFHGEFPTELEELQSLPGIGRSTAGAILAITANRPVPILDGNVKRVLTRYHAISGWPGQRAVELTLWDLAARHTPEERAADYTQAIMDLGATLCTRSRPDCDACPQQRQCEAYRRDEVEAYPSAKPKRAKPTRSTTMLVLRRLQDDAVLLQQRPPSGIWGGLWSLPECEDAEEGCIEELLGRHGLKEARREQWQGFRHTFSHFHLEITPLCLYVVQEEAPGIMEPDAGVWYKSDSFNQLGLPAPIARLLERL